MASSNITRYSISKGVAMNASYSAAADYERKHKHLMKSSAQVDWDKVHESADLLKEAFFDFGEPDVQKPLWMQPKTPQRPSWMGGGGGGGLNIRGHLLSLLLGMPIRSVEDTRSAMGALSGIMNFFRNLRSRFSPPPTLPGDPSAYVFPWRS
jgi:hypothetical protein